MGLIPRMVPPIFGSLLQVKVGLCGRITVSTLRVGVMYISFAISPPGESAVY